VGLQRRCVQDSTQISSQQETWIAKPWNLGSVSLTRRCTNMAAKKKAAKKPAAKKKTAKKK
jgi:hypothetical protein